MYTSFKQLGDLLENETTNVPTVLIENGRAAVEDLLRRHPGLVELVVPAETLTQEEVLRDSQDILDGLVEFVGRPSTGDLQSAPEENETSIKEETEDAGDSYEDEGSNDSEEEDTSPDEDEEVISVSDKGEEVILVSDEEIISVSDEDDEVILVSDEEEEEILDSDVSDNEQSKYDEEDDNNLTFVSDNYKEDVKRLLTSFNVGSVQECVIPDYWKGKNLYVVSSAYKIGKIRDGYIIYLAFLKKNYFIMTSKYDAPVKPTTKFSKQVLLWFLLFRQDAYAQAAVDVSAEWNKYENNTSQTSSASVSVPNFMKLPQYGNETLPNSINPVGWFYLNQQVQAEWGGVQFTVSGIARKYQETLDTSNQQNQPNVSPPIEFVIVREQRTKAFFIIIITNNQPILENVPTDIAIPAWNITKIDRDYPVAKIVS